MLTAAPITVPTHDLTEEPLGPNDRDSLDLQSIIRFVRANWQLVLIWICAGLCAGIAFAMLSPRYYTARATILLEDRTWRPLADAAVGAAAPDPAYADSQVQLLQSDEVVGRVVDQNRLVENEEFGKTGDGLYAQIVSYVSPGSTIAQPSRHTTMTRVKRALSIRRVGVTNAVEIGFTSHDPVRSAAIANAIAQGYIDGQRELKLLARADAAAYVRERLAELKEKAFATDPQPQDTSPATPEIAERARARLREQQNTAEIHRALYNNFLQRAYTEHDQQFSSLGPRVITPAEPPAERSWPRAFLVLAVAAAGGAAAGIGHALIRQAVDHRVTTLDDAQRSARFDRVAGVPRIEGRGWKTSTQVLPGWPAALISYRRWLPRSAPQAQAHHETPARGLQPAYVRCSAILNDAIGKVAVGLLGRQTHGGGMIVGVAAASGGAGASSIAAHLARIIAESGQKTLLVDANWRKLPVATAVLSSEPGRRLASALATIELQPESLDVLVLRAMTPISELNAALSIANTLQFHDEYDCVVVDFHSGEQTADLEASMALMTEVVVVAEAHRTSSERLHDFVRLIPRDKISAVVLNKI